MNQPGPSLAPPPLVGDRVIACDCEYLLGPDGPLPMNGVIHLKLAEVTAQSLAMLRPERVILPLIAADHDAATAIEHFEALGYKGTILILSPPLPKPRLVERELRSLGPGARLTLITPDGG